MYTSFERSVEQVLLAGFSKRLRQTRLFFWLWWHQQHDRLTDFKNVIRCTAISFSFSAMKASRLYMPIIKKTLAWGSCCNILWFWWWVLLNSHMFLKLHPIYKFSLYCIPLLYAKDWKSIILNLYALCYLFKVWSNYQWLLDGSYNAVDHSLNRKSGIWQLEMFVS